MYREKQHSSEYASDMFHTSKWTIHKLNPRNFLSNKAFLGKKSYYVLDIAKDKLQL